MYAYFIHNLSFSIINNAVLNGYNNLLEVDYTLLKKIQLLIVRYVMFKFTIISNELF